MPGGDERLARLLDLGNTNQDIDGCEEILKFFQSNERGARVRVAAQPRAIPRLTIFSSSSPYS